METTETRANTGVSPENHAPSSTQNRAPRRGISDAALRAAKPNDKPYKIAVGDGLYLEVKPSGSKLWRWKYRLLGKENRCSFGKYPNLTLKSSGCDGGSPEIQRTVQQHSLSPRRRMVGGVKMTGSYCSEAEIA